MQKKYRIGIIATSPSLIERFSIIADTQQVEYSIRTQGLDDAIPVGIEMEKNGVEVIVSRRGTEHLLRERVHIPVLSFPHRSLELMVSLQKASQISNRIGLTAFGELQDSIVTIEQLFHIELVQLIYHNKYSLRKAIADAWRDGVKVIIGGEVTRQITGEYGIDYVELRTSDEDITATIDNAKSVAQSVREQKAAAQQYRSVVDAASEGIIAVDAKGCITTINSTARNVLKLKEEEAIAQPMSRFIQGCPIHKALTNKTPLYDYLGQINQERYMFNHIPIFFGGDMIGVVTTFRHIGEVMRSENVIRQSLSKGLVAKYKLDELVHTSPLMRNLIEIGREYAKTNSTVLITGETGTGKEIFAHGIHDLSARSSHPFVSINCSALSAQLLESELFGYEEGAFTGSKKGGKLGLFEIAHQGTVFLDEIDSTPHSVQVRLLRVIQEREVMRVGGDHKITVDVRVIAATGSDLGKAVQKGKFREDLYFRINVLNMNIPPLRERQEDIPKLLLYFVQSFADPQGIVPMSLPENYLKKLMGYTWPGNVRQLRNFAERLVMNCSIRFNSETLDNLYQELWAYPGHVPTDKVVEPQPTSLKQGVRNKILNSEKSIILDALEKAKYSKSQAAQILQISRTTLWRKMKEMGIE